MANFNGIINSTSRITETQASTLSTYTALGWSDSRWTTKSDTTYANLIQNSYDTFNGTINSTGRITKTQAKKQETYINLGWEFGRTWAILENQSYPFLLKREDIVNGTPLTSRKRNTLIVEDINGTMFYNGKVYRYVGAISESEIVTGAAGTYKTWTFDGLEITDEFGTAYDFVASGVQDPGYPGNYGSYAVLTERTIVFLSTRSNNVNFYYIAKPHQESIKEELRGVGSLELANIITQKYIKSTMVGRGRFLVGAKKIVKKPIQINVVLAPGDELIIDSNFMIAIKNNVQNVSKQLNGPYPVISPGETIIAFQDNEASRNVQLTIEMKDRWL